MTDRANNLLVLAALLFLLFCAYWSLTHPDQPDLHPHPEGTNYVFPPLLIPSLRNTM